MTQGKESGAHWSLRQPSCESSGTHKMMSLTTLTLMSVQLDSIEGVSRILSRIKNINLRICKSMKMSRITRIGLLAKADLRELEILLIRNSIYVR